MENCGKEENEQKKNEKLAEPGNERAYTRGAFRVQGLIRSCLLQLGEEESEKAKDSFQRKGGRASDSCEGRGRTPGVQRKAGETGEEAKLD